MCRGKEKIIWVPLPMSLPWRKERKRAGNSIFMAHIPAYYSLTRDLSFLNSLICRGVSPQGLFFLKKHDWNSKWASEFEQSEFHSESWPKSSYAFVYQKAKQISFWLLVPVTWCAGRIMLAFSDSALLYLLSWKTDKYGLHPWAPLPFVEHHLSIIL